MTGQPNRFDAFANACVLTTEHPRIFLGSFAEVESCLQPPLADNSRILGPFAARDLVGPEEQSEYNEPRAALEAELIAATAMERTLARGILHATWRLRRCAP